VAEPHPLRRKLRPAFESDERQLTLVDLFAGCGGLTLGAAEAAVSGGRSLEVRLAVDSEEGPLRVYQANFPSAKTRQTAVEELFDGQLGGPLTIRERSLKRSVGSVDLLVGGPPCQGHSNLNNHTRRADPKNGLYLRMARAAEVLRPRAVLIENVPSVVHSSGDVVGAAAKALKASGYTVRQQVFELVGLGVAQSRRRHVLLAVRQPAPNPALVDALLEPGDSPPRSLRWAIGDLVGSSASTFLDIPSTPSADNLARMLWLLKEDKYDLPNHLRPRCHQGDHSYVSMYGRLRWSEPAQTITSGFGSIGQGRYMHPDSPRALTPHEAARIQGFPDYFQFEAARTRTELSVIIGNAVPPPLARAVVGRLLAAGVI
jgi:DNA (cytosine-5)-methyltransferase 1